MESVWLGRRRRRRRSFWCDINGVKGWRLRVGGWSRGHGIEKKGEGSDAFLLFFFLFLMLYVSIFEPLDEMKGEDKGWLREA